MTRLLLPLLVILATAACSYVDATTTQYVGVPAYARTDPDKVQVLAAEPKQRHERLGEVFVRASIEPTASRAEIEDKLRDEAANWGADAVYVVRDVLLAGKERQLVGIAVRYVR
jgi:hypothetical protein